MAIDFYKNGSVKAAIIFSIALLAFAVWRSPLLQPSKSDYARTNGAATENLLETKEYALDSDGDGIRDWEETLQGTDPLRANTNSSVEKENVVPITQADALSQDIIGTYVQAKTRGSYNPDAFAFVIAEATEDQFGVERKGTLTVQDLRRDAVSLEVYRGAFAQALSPISEIEEYELTTYGRAIETGATEDFITLANASVIYKEVANNLLAVTVPYGAAEAHVSVINSFLVFADILSTMSQGAEDPIVNMVAARDFFEGEDGIKDAYNQLDIYFILNNTTL